MTNLQPVPREGLFRRLRRRVWGLSVPAQPWGGWSDTPRVDDQCGTCGVPVTVHADTVEVAADRCARWMLGHRDSTDCREGLLVWRMSGVRPRPVVLDRDGRQHTHTFPHVVSRPEVICDYPGPKTHGVGHEGKGEGAVCRSGPGAVQDVRVGDAIPVGGVLAGARSDFGCPHTAQVRPRSHRRRSHSWPNR